MADMIISNFAKKFTAEFLMQIITKVIIMLVILFLARLTFLAMRRAVDRMEINGFLRQPLITAVKLTLRWIIIVFAIIMILSQFGFSMQSIWAFLSAILAMVAIGFVAFWSSLSNILSTFLLLIYQPFQIGDEIEIMEPTATSGLRGRVVNLDFMFTIIEQVYTEDSADGVPNASLGTQKLFQKNLEYRSCPANSLSSNERVVQVRIPNNMLFQKAVRTISNNSRINLREQLFTEKSLVD